jgi:hypothetical protein
VSNEATIVFFTTMLKLWNLRRKRKNLDKKYEKELAKAKAKKASADEIAYLARA